MLTKSDVIAVNYDGVIVAVVAVVAVVATVATVVSILAFYTGHPSLNPANYLIDSLNDQAKRDRCLLARAMPDH